MVMWFENRKLSVKVDIIPLLNGIMSPADQYDFVTKALKCKAGEVESISVWGRQGTERKLIISFTTEVVFLRMVELLRLGVEWSKCPGGKFFGTDSQVKMTSVTVKNWHRSLDIQNLKRWLSTYGEVVTCKVSTFREDKNIQNGKIYVDMIMKDESTIIPNFINLSQKYGEFLEIFSDACRRNCYKCGKEGHGAAFCRNRFSTSKPARESEEERGRGAGERRDKAYSWADIVQNKAPAQERINKVSREEQVEIMDTEKDVEQEEEDDQVRKGKGSDGVGGEGGEGEEGGEGGEKRVEPETLKGLDRGGGGEGGMEPMDRGDVGERGTLDEQGDVEKGILAVTRSGVGDETDLLTEMQVKLKSPASDSLGEGGVVSQSTFGNEHNLPQESQEQGGEKTIESTSPFLAAHLVGGSKNAPDLETSMATESQEGIPDGPTQDIQEFSTEESTESQRINAGDGISDTTHSSAMSSIPLGQGGHGGGVSSEIENNKRKSDSGSENEQSQSLLNSPSQKSDKKKKAKMPLSPRPCGGRT